MEYFAIYASPTGRILLCSDGESLTGLYFGRPRPEQLTDLPVFEETARWLDAYFRGENPPAELPMKLTGTAFQRLIWDLLPKIPYGATKTYGDLAKEAAAILGRDNMSAQAVGQAVGRNPISILYPCHRVVGAKGKLTGYTGGMENKKWLLRHEGLTVGETSIE